MIMHTPNSRQLIPCDIRPTECHVVVLTPTKPVQPVPEPAGMLVLAAGVAAVAARCLRGRK